MKNMMTKSTLREIRGSLTRWLAILAIVMLGVGFFCGLKVCKDAFILTGDTFLDEHNLFDYELISTLGLDDESVDTINAVDGVRYAEGSWSADILFEEEGTENGENVAKLHTVSEKISTLSLVEGRMPESADECVVDSLHFSSEDIGKTIHLTDGNEEDTLDMLAGREYTITGLATSPLYLNFERGSTSLGDGKVAAFIYITPEAWDCDYFTEIYVDLEKTAPIFTDEYKEIADSMEDPLTEAIESCGTTRYDEIMDEANEKLSDAEEKLADAKANLADGEKKLKDNEKKLADAEKEIRDNQKKLDDSEKDLKKAKAEYEDGVEKYNSEKADAYEQLDQLKAQVDIAAGTPYYDQYLAQYTQAKAQADSQFESAWAELERGRIEIEKGEKKISDGRQELKEARADLADGRKKIADGKQEIADGKKKIADAEEELDDARDEIDDIEHPDTYVLGRDTNIGYICFENDSSIVDGIAKLFPIFFFIVAALVVMTTMTRMVDEQRTQIGVLKALGYSRNTILKKYVIYSASATLIGGLTGFISGSYAFPWVIWAAYGMMYNFSDIIFVIDWKLGGLSIMAALVCAVGSTIFSCYRELKEVPSQLIRPKTPAMGKRILLERIGFIWKRLSFLRKVSMRNIFRYKKRFFMMIIGVCGCTALLVAAFGINDSVKNVVSDQYDNIFHVDYTVTFDKDLTADEQQEFMDENSSVISDCLFLNALSVDAHAGNAVKSVNMVVAEKDAPIEKFIDLHNEDGPITFPGDGECVINENLAQKLGLEAGDTLTVFDSDMREMNLKITALCENYVYHYVYLNRTSYEEQWGHMETNTAFVLGVIGEDGEIADTSADGAYLMNADNVASVSITKDFRDRISNMMKSMNYIIMLVVGCAGALAFIVLYNLTNINITERIREIATIKVLGFYPNETSSYVFRENIMLTAIAALVGLPIGKVLHAFIINQIQIDLMSFNMHIQPLSYVLAVVMTFVFAGIVNFVMYFRLEKVSMTESLKSIE